MSIDRVLPGPKEDRDGEPPPSSADPFRRPTRPVPEDVYVRATVPGVYPDAARERSLREAATPARSVRLTQPMPPAFAAPAQATPFPPPARATPERAASLAPHTTTSPDHHASAAAAPARTPWIARGLLAALTLVVVGLVASFGRQARRSEVATAAPPAVAAPAATAETAAPIAAAPEPAPPAECAPAPPVVVVKLAAPRAEPAPPRAAPSAPAPPRAPNRPFDVER